MGRNKHKIPVFLFLFLCGIGFGVWAMLTPPGGVIDPSVLILIAQIFVLAASVPFKINVFPANLIPFISSE